MTLEDVAQRIKRVRDLAAARDYDQAQALEAQLHDDVCIAIDAGCAGVEHAKLALTSLNLDFPRRGQ